MTRCTICLILSGLLWSSSCAFFIAKRGIGCTENKHAVRTGLYSTPPFLSPFPSSSASSTDHDRYMMEAFDTRVWPSPNTFSSNTSSSQRVTLTRYLSGLVQDQPELRDIEGLLMAIQMACKTISNLVNRNRINQSSSYSDQKLDIGTLQSDMRRNSMIKLDQLSASVLRNALSFTGKLQMVRPAEDMDEHGLEEGPDEHKPGVLIASGLDSRYVAYFDPLDGSGNADAAICTGTVFGIFESNEDTGEEGVDDVVVGGGDGSYTGSKRDDSMVQAVLQPAKNLRAAGYCLYSSATIFIFSLGDGTHGFTLDPRVGEFVMTHPNIRIPTRGNVYSCNEANSVGWSDDVSTFVRALKTGKGETGEKYALRYIGSFVGDIHRTLMYGGIFLYPSDNDGHPKGNLQLLYKSSPLAFLVEQAGGKSTNGHMSLLEITPTRVHEKSPCFIGSPEDIDELMNYIIK